MGWLDSILEKTTEAGVRNHARETCKAMVFTASQFAKNPGADPECSTSGGVARKALECRPGWKRKPGTDEFTYKGRMDLRIVDAWTVAKTAKEVVMREVTEIASASPNATMLVAQAILACEDYFRENPTH